MNTFVFVWIYGGLRACLFLFLFTCPAIFILLSRHNNRPDMTYDVYRGRKTTIQQQQLDTTCKHYYVIKMTQTFSIALLWKPDLCMFPECIKTSRLITHNSEMKVPEQKCRPRSACLVMGNLIRVCLFVHT